MTRELAWNFVRAYKYGMKPIEQVRETPAVSRRDFIALLTGGSLSLFLRLEASSAADVMAGTEEGEFKIFIGGKEIGNERFVITSSETSATSTSVLQFRNPTGKREKIELETKLDMNGQYVPLHYELKSNVDGEKGSIIGTFSPNQAMFEYLGGPVTRKSGLVVGERFTLLDTNIFHHFIFLTRLFDYGSTEKSQKFEVAIPQEPDSGFLNISQLSPESIKVGNKKLLANHLRADSGTLVVDLWVDSQRLLQKIAVKSKNLEVIR